MKLSDLLNPGGAPPRPPVSDDTAAQNAAAQGGATPPRLDKQQQAFLAEIREALPRQVTAHLAEDRRIKGRFSRLLNHTQRGSWESFCPLIDCLRQFDLLSARGAIVLGGWHRTPDPAALKSPSPDLVTNVFALGIYGEMLARIKTAYAANWNIAEEKKRVLAPVWDWAEKFPGSFSSAETDGSGTLGDYRKVAQEAFASLVPRITEELLFMDDKAFIFHPSEKDAAAGWQDFFDFTWGYNFLPDDLKRSFKSHYLIIQIPAS